VDEPLSEPEKCLLIDGPGAPESAGGYPEIPDKTAKLLVTTRTPPALVQAGRPLDPDASETARAAQEQRNMVWTFAEKLIIVTVACPGHPPAQPPTGAPAQVLARLIDDAIRLGAVVGRRFGPRTHHFQLDLHVLGLAVPPADQPKNALAGLGLRRAYRLGIGHAGVRAERLAVDTEDDVVLSQHTVGRRALGDLGDQYLPRGARVFLAAANPDPSACAGRPEVPVVVDARPGPPGFMRLVCPQILGGIRQVESLRSARRGRIDHRAQH